MSHHDGWLSEGRKYTNIPLGNVVVEDEMIIPLVLLGDEVIVVSKQHSEVPLYSVQVALATFVAGVSRRGE